MQIEIWQAVVIPVILAAIGAVSGLLGAKAGQRKTRIEAEQLISQMAYRQCEEYEKENKKLEDKLTRLEAEFELTAKSLKETQQALEQTQATLHITQNRVTEAEINIECYRKIAYKLSNQLIENDIPPAYRVKDCEKR